MSALITLILVTAAILYVQFRIWRSHKNLVFPIITLVLYVWSLLGAWLFVFDSLTGYGKQIGLAYHYLLEKMFTVSLNASYTKAIVSYGTFILLFQGFSALGLRYIGKKFPQGQKEDQPAAKTLTLSQTPFLLIGIVALLGSFYLVKDVLVSALILNESVYSNVRSGGVPHFNFHQYFNWIMILSLVLYLGLYFRKQANKPNWIFYFFFGLIIFYLSFIGSRHELFFAGIFLILFISYPSKSIRDNKRFYIAYFVSFFVILAVNDPLRGIASNILKKVGITSAISTKQNLVNAEVYSKDRTFFLHKDAKRSTELIEASKLRDTILVLEKDTVTLKQFDLSEQIKVHPEYVIVDQKRYHASSHYVSMQYQKLNGIQKAVKAVTNIIFSNELFAGHFSLYGIYEYNVSPNYGLVFRNVIRSETTNTYQYYVTSLKFPKDQGFTINHVSAWYLNFGYFGIVLGAAFLSFTYLIPLYFFSKFNGAGQRREMFVFVILIGMTAYMPLIVRSDLLVYEGLIKQVIVVPSIMLFFAFVYKRILRKNA